MNKKFLNNVTAITLALVLTISTIVASGVISIQSADEDTPDIGYTTDESLNQCV